MKRLEITPGTTYGDLSVICEANSDGKRKFLCVCSCGAKIEARLDHLRSSHTTSCGRCGILYNGERKTLREWAAAYKIKESTLRARLKTMQMREALTRGNKR